MKQQEFNYSQFTGFTADELAEQMKTPNKTGVVREISEKGRAYLESLKSAQSVPDKSIESIAQKIKSEIQRKKVAQKKESADFKLPAVEEVDTLKLYFENPINVDFWSKRFPLLDIWGEFDGIYESLMKKNALKLYFENPINIDFWSKRFPLLCIRGESYGIYESLMKKAANGSARLNNPYIYVLECLENAEKKRQQRVVAQKNGKAKISIVSSASKTVNPAKYKAAATGDVFLNKAK